jgi:hypothetical protein
MLSALILIGTLNASAAEVTDTPTQWRGDIRIDYEAAVIPDSLREGKKTVGDRRAVDHLITPAAKFGFTDYLALELALPLQVSSRIAFKNMNRMAYDPVQKTGTMLGTDPEADSKTSGSGAGGLWVRVMGTPMSEQAFSKRGDQITWLMGLGYQFKDSTSRWNSPDSNGAGPASPAFEFTSIWSTKNRITEPYLGLVWTHRFQTGVDVGDTTVKVKDPSSLDLTAGMEILLYSNDDWANKLGTELALDLHATFGHSTWGDGVSGIELSGALPISTGKTVTQGETNSLWGGFDLRWRVVRYLDWTISTDFGGPWGRRLEHPYAVASAPDGKLGWKLGTGLTFRMRDPLFDKR